MKVQFKTNPQMQYDIREENNTHYRLPLVGWVPKTEVEPLTKPELPDAIDVLVYLTNITLHLLR